MQRLLTCLTLALALAAPAYADDSASAKPADKAGDQDKPKEESKQSHGSVTVAGQALKYTATAGTLIIKNDKDEPEASVFYVAYTLDGADAKKRPVTFLYNGGPGSASIWLHM